MIRGTLYWVLVKSMCRARLQPGLMFGCSLWSSEIDRREDRSSSDTLVHLLSLKVQQAVTLHVGIKSCHLNSVSKSCCRSEEIHNDYWTKAFLHRKNNKQHLYGLSNHLRDWLVYFQAGRLLICSIMHSMTDRQIYVDIEICADDALSNCLTWADWWRIMHIVLCSTNITL